MIWPGGKISVAWAPWAPQPTPFHHSQRVVVSSPEAVWGPRKSQSHEDREPAQFL